MSGGARSEPRGVLIRRRAALALHILFQVLVVIGSQGPWYQPTLAGKPVGDPVTGREFALHAAPPPAPVDPVAGAPAPDPDAPPRQPAAWEQPGFLATLALFAAIAAFFFTSYDLVANRDLQVMPLLASLVVVLCAWWAYHAVRSSQAVLDDVIREVQMAGGAAVATSDSTAGVEARLLPGLRVAWGAALFLAAAPQMLLVSLYLTFIAQRQPAERS